MLRSRCCGFVGGLKKGVFLFPNSAAGVTATESSILSAAFHSASAAVQAPSVAIPSWQRAAELLQLYKQLSKAKLSLLVVASAGAGYVAGSPEDISWPGLGWTVAGTFCAAACANTLNQVYEVLPDGKMKRTNRRPLPTGRLPVGHALAFAAVTGGLGVSILATKVPDLAGHSSVQLHWHWVCLDCQASFVHPLKQDACS